MTLFPLHRTCLKCVCTWLFFYFCQFCLLYCKTSLPQSESLLLRISKEILSKHLVCHSTFSLKLIVVKLQYPKIKIENKVGFEQNYVWPHASESNLTRFLAIVTVHHPQTTSSLYVYTSFSFTYYLMTAIEVLS